MEITGGANFKFHIGFRYVYCFLMKSLIVLFGPAFNAVWLTAVSSCL